MSIKGSWRRPRSITREEEELRGKYFDGKIGYTLYKKQFAKLKRQGLIQRSGQVIK